MASGACSDLTIPGGGPATLPESELLFLPLDASAPPPTSRTFYVSNRRRIVERLTHDDGFNTPYVEIAFAANSLASLDGVSLGPADSVEVTVSPRDGEYGITLSPAGLELVSGREAELRFFYEVFGEASVADGSATYRTRLEYLNALRLWEEVTPGVWNRVTNSFVIDTDNLGARLSRGGVYAVGAPR